jgi:hypothetical protein
MPCALIDARIVLEGRGDRRRRIRVSQVLVTRMEGKALALADVVAPMNLYGWGYCPGVAPFFTES